MFLIEGGSKGFFIDLHFYLPNIFSNPFINAQKTNLTPISNDNLDAWNDDQSY